MSDSREFAGNDTLQTRIAKSGDELQLADLHFICSADQPGGFIFNLGRSFLRQYYYVLLREKYSVVLCVENENGKLIGLVSGSLRAEEHISVLKKHRFRLALASIPALLKKPRLLGGLISRQRFKDAESEDTGYIVQSGTREEFWAWHPNYRETGGAIELHKNWLSFMRMLGASRVRLELDRINIKVEQIQRFLGAKVVKEIVTPDGKTRIILQFDLR